jgi:thiol-disulfide isomerase/thioredoxin
VIHRLSAAARLLAAVTAAGLALSGCARAAHGNTTTTPAGSSVVGLTGHLPTWQAYPVGHRTTPRPVSGELLDGTPFDLAAWRGHVVVVNIWASWCAPCRAEAKGLNAAYEHNKGHGVQFLGVDIRDDRDAAHAFRRSFAVPYPSLFDPTGKITLALRGVSPSTIPTTAILDRAGRVAAVFRERVTETDVQTVLDKVLTEAVAGG